MRRVLIILALGGLGCDSHRSYTRHPLFSQMDVVTGPVAPRENSTQAEPYPPPAPELPRDPGGIASR
jgi:hypothetical protein